MAHGIHDLPPKMAAQFTERARRGEGRHIGLNMYEFIQGNIRITLVSLDPPIGYQEKITQAEADRLRAKINQ